MPVEDDRGRTGDSRTDGSIVELAPEDVLEDSRLDDARAVAPGPGESRTDGSIVDLGPDDLLEPVPGATLNSAVDYARLASLVGETVDELPPLPGDVTLVPASSLRPVARPSSIPKPIKRPKAARVVPLRDMGPPSRAGSPSVPEARGAEQGRSSMLGLGLAGVLVVAGSVAFVLYDREGRLERLTGARENAPVEDVSDVGADSDLTEAAVAAPETPPPVEQAQPGAQPAAPPQPSPEPQPAVKPPDDDEPVVIIDPRATKKPKPAAPPPSEPEESEPSPEAIAAAATDACKDFRRAASLAREAGDWKAMSAALEHGECWPAKDVLAQLRKKARSELAKLGDGTGQ